MLFCYSVIFLLAFQNANAQASGDATWYDVRGISACGTEHKNSEMITAIGVPYWDPKIGNPNNDPICGRRVRVTNNRNGRKVTVTIRDKCMSCGRSNLDLSPAAFEALGESLSVGRIKIRWEFV